MNLPIYLSLYLHHHHHPLSFALVSWTATAIYNHVTLCHTVTRRVSTDLLALSEGLLITPLVHCVLSHVYYPQEQQQLTYGESRRHQRLSKFWFCVLFVCLIFLFLLCCFSLHHIILSYSFFFSITDRNASFEGKFLSYLCFEYFISLTTSLDSFLFTCWPSCKQFFDGEWKHQSVPSFYVTSWVQPQSLLPVSVCGAIAQLGFCFLKVRWHQKGTLRTLDLGMQQVEIV